MGILYIIFLYLVLIAIPVILGLVLYYVPKKMGHPKVAKYLGIVYAVLFLFFTVKIIFEDQLFSKNDAKELVEAQGLTLQDDFVLIKNKSSSAIGDYYHTFSLKISKQDKQRAIAKIKNAKGFVENDSAIDHRLYMSKNHYFGPKVIQNYQSKTDYVTEYFEPSGQEGYAPTFRRISIGKDNDILVFEDIDE